MNVITRLKRQNYKSCYAALNQGLVSSVFSTLKPVFPKLLIYLSSEALIHYFQAEIPTLMDLIWVT